jgi:hypothetical protein
MPTDNEQKPCNRAGCPGTMTFDPMARRPGDDDVWGSGPIEPGWVCDTNCDHFDAIDQESTVVEEVHAKP